MKNAADHAKTLEALRKKLTKAHKVGDKPPKIGPLDALIWAVLAEDATDAKAEKALDQIHDVYVDYNELRAASAAELHDVLGVRYPGLAERCDRLHHLLHAIFLAETKLDLSSFLARNKKEQREYLTGLDGMTPFVEGYTMLYAADAAALPMDRQMLAYLADAGAVEAETTPAEAQRFCEQHVKADDCHPFFQSLRVASTDPQPDDKPKKKPAKKAG